MEHIGSFFGPLNWSALLIDAAKDELVFSAVIGKSADALTGQRMPINEGIAGWVACHGKPAIVEEVATDARFSDRLDKLTGFRTESVIAVPLRAGGKVFGVIELLNRFDGRAFSAYDMADFAKFNEVYAKYFAEKPARSCVAVKALPKGVLVEVEAIAYRS